MRPLPPAPQQPPAPGPSPGSPTAVEASHEQPQARVLPPRLPVSFPALAVALPRQPSPSPARARRFRLRLRCGALAQHRPRLPLLFLLSSFPVLVLAVDVQEPEAARFVC